MHMQSVIKLNDFWLIIRFWIELREADTETCVKRPVGCRKLGVSGRGCLCLLSWQHHANFIQTSNILIDAIYRLWSFLIVRSLTLIEFLISQKVSLPEKLLEEHFQDEMSHETIPRRLRHFPRIYFHLIFNCRSRIIYERWTGAL